MSGGWLSRLKAGLSRSSGKLSGGIGGLFAGGRKIDAAMLTELEDVLITADLGVATSARLADGLRKRRFPDEAGEAEVRTALAEDIAAVLDPVARPIEDLARGDARPRVILVAGVNGTGKTTTIGKLAARFREAGHSVMLAAGDTFRAAAIEQLCLWGERVGVPVVARETGADPAAVAYEALEKARADGAEILLIDTAGRLHNKADLMAELSKIVRVIRKLDPDAPHDVLLVLDATVGQNAHAQVETFRQIVDVSGLVVTKLDGSARGGVIVGLADRFELPIYAIGVGESVDDLRPFEARAFADNLLGVASE